MCKADLLKPRPQHIPVMYSGYCWILKLNIHARFAPSNITRNMYGFPMYFSAHVWLQRRGRLHIEGV
jgi:hypothetical protein